MSVGYDIRVAVKAIVVAMGISGITTDNIKIRMMVRALKGIDRLPCIIIAPYGTIDDKPADFEGSRGRIFRVRVAIIDAMTGDTETHDELYSQWIEDIINAVLVQQSGPEQGFSRETLAGIDGVWQIRAETIATFDDSKMEQGYYAYQNAVFRFEWQ